MRRRPARRKAAGFAGLASLPLVRYTPPNSLAATVQSGFAIKFAAGEQPGSIRIALRMRVCQAIAAGLGVVEPYQGKYCFKFKHTVGATPVYSFILPLILNQTYYYPEGLTSLVNLFNMWKVHRSCIEYEPRQGTSNNSTSFTLGYVEDIEWFESRALLFASGVALPNEFSISALSNSCTNNGWSPCEVYSTHRDKKERYLSYQNQLQDINFLDAGNNPAELRQSICGAYMIASENANGATGDIVLGDIYLCIDMTLSEFNLAGRAFDPEPLRKEEKYRERERKLR